MSQTDQGHWREPPKDRVDPDYPPYLTERFGAMEVDDDVVIYDDIDTDERWINGEGYNREDLL